MSARFLSGNPCLQPPYAAWRRLVGASAFKTSGKQYLSLMLRTRAEHEMK